jgi:hypothetical protein
MKEKSVRLGAEGDHYEVITSQGTWHVFGVKSVKTNFFGTMLYFEGQTSIISFSLHQVITWFKA